MASSVGHSIGALGRGIGALLGDGPSDLNAVDWGEMLGDAVQLHAFVSAMLSRLEKFAETYGLGRPAATICRATFGALYCGTAYAASAARQLKKAAQQAKAMTLPFERGLALQLLALYAPLASERR